MDGPRISVRGHSIVNIYIYTFETEMILVDNSVGRGDTVIIKGSMNE